MAFVDDVLADFHGDLTYQDVIHMTYKEIGYLREHRKKYHPKEMDAVTKALLGVGAPKKSNKPKAPGSTVRNPYLNNVPSARRSAKPRSKYSRSHR